METVWKMQNSVVSTVISQASRPEEQITMKKRTCTNHDWCRHDL